MADTGLVPLFEQKFSTYLELKLQQMGSLLRGKVSEQAFSGAKLASPLNQIGPVSMVAPAGRFSPKTITPHDFTRRWVAPTDRELDQLTDNFDLLKTQIDPQSQFVTSAAQAVGRFYDDLIIAAATAASTIGPDAGSLTTEAFSGYQIAVDYGASAATGLTVKKLNEARRMLEHAHNDLSSDRPTLVIGSQQHADLRDQAQVVSSDFNRNGGVLTDGKVTAFMGFDIVVSERLPETTAGSVRENLVFVKSGICLGVWMDQKTQIFQRPELSSNPWDVNTMASAGATRTQLGKVIQILVADTTGADTPAT